MRQSFKIKNWPAFLGGVGCLLFGGCAIVKADFHMSNYGLYLTGAHAIISGALLLIFGLYAVYCGLGKKDQSGKKPNGA